MTTTLAALRRADAEAKRNLREAERNFDKNRLIWEIEILTAIGGEECLGKNAEARKRNMEIELFDRIEYRSACLGLEATRDQAALCALDLQIALDERDERRLKARERFTEVLAYAFNVPSGISPDDAAVDAAQDEMGDAVAETIGEECRCFAPDPAQFDDEREFTLPSTVGTEVAT